jgi:tRNA dimethylallyltransferase
VPARVLCGRLSPKTLHALIGPTASGKESTSLVLAERYDLEILSLDSMKLYCGMDVGTAKASLDARKRVRHHLVDLADVAIGFSTREWLAAADRALADVALRGRRPIFSGGTALYLKALLYGLFEGPAAQPELRARLKATPLPELHRRLSEVDPVSAARIHVNDLRRLVRALEIFMVTGTPPSTLRHQWESEKPTRSCRIAGVRRERPDLYARINLRVDRMVDAGLVREVEGLLALPGGLGPVARQALGYKEIADFLEGTVGSLDEAIELIKRRTRHFARHQITWFKQFEVEWVDAGPEETAREIAPRAARALGLEPR